MEQIFANNIKRLRKNADLTQEELARAIGMSAQSVSKWECGVSQT
ncbi:MAG: helix-turn-helix transcriptional regulator [Clostridia bacterium]|nr:helix-turn-helix transcriptional regulator [Clostridia bacterium]